MIDDDNDDEINEWFKELPEQWNYIMSANDDEFLNELELLYDYESRSEMKALIKRVNYR